MISYLIRHILAKTLPLPRWEGMKGRGNQKVFILFTPTLTLTHRRGREFLERSEMSFLVFNVHTIMD
jgi:hypothetical protein